MPVSGRELATLDFANLIGGPLNAVIEAQAKSAITTANFIKEVAFDKEGKVVNVDFSYNRVNDDGKDQEFTLTVPFLTMLPVPYITVSSARIEFNAKINSITETNSSSNFSNETDASVGGRYWFVSAKLNTKTAYQKKSSTTDKEERTFDMHIVVEAQNADMPAGTERILTILEQAITERKGPVTWMTLQLGESTNKRITFTIDSPPVELAEAKDAIFKMANGKSYKVASVTVAVAAVAEVKEGDTIRTPAKAAVPASITFSEALPPEVKLVRLSKTS